MSITTSAKDASIKVHLSCFCKAFTSALNLPTSLFPLKSGICHCASCRHSSGHIFGTFIPLPLSTKPSSLTDHPGLFPYHQTKNLTRWSCRTCGASIYNDNPAAEIWVPTTGVIESVECPTGDDEHLPKSMLEGLQDRVQCFVGADSTGDGGAAVWINGGKEEGMPRLLDMSGNMLTDAMLHDVVATAREKIQHGKPSGDADMKLPIHCACGQVQLSLERDSPDEKFAAGFDACTSCRRVTGVEVASWVTTTFDRLRHSEDDSALDLDRECFGKYHSSEGVLRVFCTGCGASIFYYKASEGTIAFGAGLVDAPEGARAESWLEWNKKYGDGCVLFTEDAIDHNFVDGLVRGIENDSQHK